MLLSTVRPTMVPAGPYRNRKRKAGFGIPEHGRLAPVDSLDRVA
jgi:hypothetical protein